MWLVYAALQFLVHVLSPLAVQVIGWSMFAYAVVVYSRLLLRRFFLAKNRRCRRTPDRRQRADEGSRAR
jgi:hypothetical protein